MYDGDDGTETSTEYLSAVVNNTETKDQSTNMNNTDTNALPPKNNHQLAPKNNHELPKKLILYPGKIYKGDDMEINDCSIDLGTTPIRVSSLVFNCPVELKDNNITFDRCKFTGPVNIKDSRFIAKDCTFDHSPADETVNIDLLRATGDCQIQIRNSDLTLNYEKIDAIVSLVNLYRFMGSCELSNNHIEYNINGGNSVTTVRVSELSDKSPTVTLTGNNITVRSNDNSKVAMYDQFKIPPGVNNPNAPIPKVFIHSVNNTTKFEPDINGEAYWADHSRSIDNPTPETIIKDIFLPELPKPEQKEIEKKGQARTIHSTTELTNTDTDVDISETLKVPIKVFLPRIDEYTKPVKINNKSGLSQMITRCDLSKIMGRNEHILGPRDVKVYAPNLVENYWTYE